LVNPETGEEMWLHSQGAMTTDTADGNALFCGVTQNITERKRYEEQLRRAAELNEFRVKLNDALRPQTDSGNIQQQAVRVLGEWLETDSAHYTEIDENLGLYRVRREFVRGAAARIAGDHPMSAFGWLDPELRKGVPLVVADAETSPLIPDAQRAAV